MELILLIAALLLFDILAMRFGVDSRLLGLRDGRGGWPELMNGDVWHDTSNVARARLQHEAHLQRLVSPAGSAQPSFRVRLAAGMRALAVRIDPVCAPGPPTGGLPYPVRHTPTNGVAHVLPH